MRLVQPSVERSYHIMLSLRRAQQYLVNIFTMISGPLGGLCLFLALVFAIVSYFSHSRDHTNWCWSFLVGMYFWLATFVGLFIVDVYGEYPNMPRRNAEEIHNANSAHMVSYWSPVVYLLLVVFPSLFAWQFIWR